MPFVDTNSWRKKSAVYWHTVLHRSPATALCRHHPVNTEYYTIPVCPPLNISPITGMPQEGRAHLGSCYLLQPWLPRLLLQALALEPVTALDERCLQEHASQQKTCACAGLAGLSSPSHCTCESQRKRILCGVTRNWEALCHSREQELEQGRQNRQHLIWGAACSAMSIYVRTCARTCTYTHTCVHTHIDTQQ